MVKSSFAATIFLLISLNLKVSYSETKESPFKKPGKFCGPRFTEQLHDFCELFYGPGDVTTIDRINPKVIADECCEEPCSILYIILNYCKEPKNEAIKNTFGEEAIKIYEDTKRNIANGTLDMLTLNKTLQAVVTQSTESQQQNVRRRKHVRKYRKKKKSCKCRRSSKHLAKIIPSRRVPDFLIGFADYYENEPIIIANSL